MEEATSMTDHDGLQPAALSVSISESLSPSVTDAGDSSWVDYVLFIGRFQPFHNGHLSVARAGLEHGKKIIVILGSANEPRMPKNIWSVTERTAMISHAMAPHADRLLTGSVVNFYDLPRWVEAVQTEVARLIRADGKDPATATVRIIGRNKDRTSYYITHFPQYAPLIQFERTEVMGATEMRNHYFANDRGGDMLIQANVPAPVYDLMMAFRRSAAYPGLARCHEDVVAYPKKYGPGPHVTTDAVVTHRDHILMVTRKNHPGMNQWALPGGFLEPDESLLSGVLRELNEETLLDVSKEQLRRNFRLVHVLADVDRDPRARMLSHVHGFVLDPTAPRPQVSAIGGDDTKKAEWLPIREVLASRERLFLDHHCAIERFTQHPDMQS